MIEEQISTRSKTVAENIKRVRLQRNYKQQYLGAKLNISQNAYSKIELGRTSVNIEKLFRIADILEVNIMELIGWDYLESIVDHRAGLFSNRLAG